MEYITVAETAEKWGVTVRQVQRLLAANRIPGIRTHGQAYMIPADAEKPGDPRRCRGGNPPPAPQKSLSADLAGVIAATSFSMPRDNPEAIMDYINDERIRLLYQGFFAYMRGDFERVKQNFLMLKSDDAAKLRACSIVISAAVNTGDYQFFEYIEAYCKDIIAANMGADVTAVADHALASAYVGAFVPNMVVDWLKDGDFSALPTPLKPDALCSRVRYLHFLKKYESIIDIARTALTLEESDRCMSYMSIFLRILCAAAYCSLGRFYDAKTYLLDVMKDCLPHGFITILALHEPLFGGLLERLLKQNYPEYYDAVIGLSTSLIPNWLDFHNRSTKDNITTILTTQEYQVALLFSQGKSREEIAKLQLVSLSRVKAIIEVIYGKLFVSSKSELAKYIL